MYTPQKPSHQLTFEEAVQVVLAVWRGEFKNRIAARYDVNPWRIYDVLNGKLHARAVDVAHERLNSDKTAA